MKTKKLSILLAATFAAGSAMMAFTPVAGADREPAKGVLKAKPPVAQLCDPAAYQLCLANYNPPYGPATINHCKAVSGCDKEVN